MVEKVKKLKRNRRGREKYPAVKPNLNLKTRYEEIVDIASYFNTLPEEAKKFMHSFVEEYVNAKFDHKGKKIFKTKKQKREIYNRNNARNRDVLTKAKASGNYIEIDDAMSKSKLINEEAEQQIIQALDYKLYTEAEKSKKRRKKSIK